MLRALITRKMKFVAMNGDGWRETYIVIISQYQQIPSHYVVHLKLIECHMAIVP